MNKIKNKLLLVLLIVALVPAIFIGGYSMYSTSKALKENVLVSHVNKLSLIQERIQNQVSSVEGDIFYLHSSNALQLYLSYTESDGARTERLLLSNLRSSLKKFSEQKEIYQQVRFIDTNGQEIVRIDRALGKSKNISDTHLQNKASRYYVASTFGMEEGQLFISALDLNRENGQVEEPYQPTLRYSTPVFDKEDVLKGIIVLNIDANMIINVVKEQHKLGEQLLFVDQQGYYYYNSIEKVAWSRDLNNSTNLFKDKPELVGRLKDKQQSGYVETDNDILIYKPIAISRQQHSLGAIYSIQSKSALFQPLKDYLWIFLGIALVALSLAAILAVMLSNSITRPLITLKENVESLSQGDMDTLVETRSKDEIGDVAHAVELLRKSMKILMKRSG